MTAFSREDAETQQQLWLVCQAAGGASSTSARPVLRGASVAAGEAVGMKRLVVTTSHVLSLHVGNVASASGGAASSGERPGGGTGAEGEKPQLEWYERLVSIATAEESGGEVVLHLRDGGMRFVPCAGGQRERRACFDILHNALQYVEAHSAE